MLTFSFKSLQKLLLVSSNLLLFEVLLSFDQFLLLNVQIMSDSESDSDDDHQRLIDAFPVRHESRNYTTANIDLGVGADVGFTTFGRSPPEIFTSMVLKKLTSMFRSVDRTTRRGMNAGDSRAARRVRFQSFGLAMFLRGELDVGDGDVQVVDRYTDLGTLNRDDLTDQSGRRTRSGAVVTHSTLHNEIIEWLSDHEGGVGSGREIHTLHIAQFRLIIYDLEWGIRGGCARGQGTVNLNGVLVCSVKSKENECGLMSVLHALKKMKSSFDRETWARVRNRKAAIKTMKSEYNIDKSASDEVWHPYDLALLCITVSVSIEIYSSEAFKFGDETGVPIFSRACEGRSIATIRLMLVESDLIFAEDAYTGHYVVILRFNITCDKCGLDLAAEGKHHVCKFPCLHCGELFGGSMKHLCPVIMQNARERVAEFLDGDGSAGINGSLVEEVKQIMSGDVDDTAIIQSWRESIILKQPSFLAGDAGTGKTYQINRVVREAVNNYIAAEGNVDPTKLSIDGKNIAIICPEAVACDNYRGLIDGVSLKDLGVNVSTIHSFLSLNLTVKPKKRAELILEAHTNALMMIRERIRSIQMLVIDEIGSCSTKLFSIVDQMLRIIRACNLPFGGIPYLIVSGDFRQRPGFNDVTQADSYKRIPLFMSQLWSEINIQTFTLLQQRRVANLESEDEKHFITCLMLMSRGVIGWKPLKWLNQHCVEHETKYDDPSVVHLMMTNKKVYNIGHKCLEKYYSPDKITEYPVLTEELELKDGEVIVQSGELSGLRRTYDQVLKLAVGAPVMFTTNRYVQKDGAMANGSVGIVSALQDDAITVSVRDGAYSVVVKRDMVSKKLGKQFPLRLAFSRTIHKSQGATMSKVRVYPSDQYIPESKNGGNIALIYVAISRVKSITGLSLAHRIENYHITVCARSVWYMKLIQTHSHYEVIAILKRCFNRESKDETPYTLYPFNMRSVDHYISIPSKKVVDLKRGIKMYSRDELKVISEKSESDRTWWEKHPYIGNFHNVIYFDFETAPDDIGIQTPYYVVARFWQDSEIKSELRYGILPDGTVGEDTIGKFCKWMMTLGVRRVQSYREAKGKAKNFMPIRLVAYNGSSFDFSFIFKWLLKYASNLWEGLTYSIINKGSSIVIGKIIMTIEDHELDMFSVWDPCLFLSSTLDRAHASFCREKHVNVKKDAFPHIWIGEVGVAEAFGVVGEVELEIIRAFPSQMLSTVKSRIEEGTLKRGRSDEWVFFNPVKELLSYVTKDVDMMENVVESFSMTVWKDIFDEACIPVWNFSTCPGLGFYATVFKLNPKYLLKDEDSFRTRSKLHRLTKRLDKFIRESVYGGRTLNAALRWSSSQLDDVESRIAAIAEPDSVKGKQEAFDIYDSVTDCHFYLDKVGLYHYIARSSEFPYGKETELTDISDIDHFMECFLKNPESKTFPMFVMKLDLIPNVHDTSSAVPQRRDKQKKLVWTNKPLKQGVYNSVHLQMALRRGYKLSNPTRVVVWGEREVVETRHRSSTRVQYKWIGTRGQMFKESCDKWMDLRREGGAKKVVGKLIANSGPFGGMLKRDFHTESCIYVAKPDENCVDMIEYVKRLRNPAWKMKHERAYVSENGTATLMVQWEETVDDDNFICTRASYIGSFITAYGHVQIDNAIEDLFGDARRDGTVNAQPMNGDTDSIFFHASALMDKNGKSKVTLHNTTLGAFSDDLDDYYNASKEITYSKRTGLPLFAKIIEAYNPAKKVYGNKIITPDGKIIVINPKTKGISKGSTNRILTGKQAREIVTEYKEEMMMDLPDTASTSRKRKRDIAKQLDDDTLSTAKRAKFERDIIADYFEEKNEPYSQQVDFNKLREQCLDESSGGLIASSMRMKKHGLISSAKDFANGVDSYSIQNRIMTRHILKDGAYFPPGRRAVTSEENPNDGGVWSVPDDWVDSSKC